MAKNEKTFNEQNMRKIIKILSGLSSAQQQLAEQCINEYDPTRTYQKDNICFFNGTLYRAKTVTNGNEPSPESTYFEMLDGVEEEIDAQYIETLMSTVSAETWDYLKDFINNDIISTTHAWSSSRAYTEIQNAIQVAKDYTLEKIANSSTGSYVIANGTDEVVDDKHLFLISNGSNYDIYALVSGAPTKIGDTSVSLNGLLTEATAESTYLKQTDATSTYATITTTDGLRTDLDKINVEVDGVSYTQTDGKITLPNYPTPRTDDEIKTLADGQINAKMTTTINSSSTDTQVPSAKSVYNNSLTKALNDGNTTIPSNSDLNDYLTPGIYTCRSSSAAKTLLNCPHTSSNFKLIVNQNTGNTTSFNGYQMIAGTAAKTFNPCIYYRGIAWNASNPIYSSWQRVCITTIADVAWTNLTINSWATGTVRYCVKNGICYVHVQTLKSSTMNSGGQTITSGLPVPQLTVWHAIASNKATQGSVLVKIDATGKMVNSSGLNDAIYFGTFSYPVAES